MPVDVGGHRFSWRSISAPKRACSRPEIDALDEPTDLLVATGVSGHGLAVGPFVGRLLAKLTLEREEPGQILLRYPMEHFVG